jgi:FtsH-binding integral membrane protein
MAQVYGWMTVGLLLTAFIAWFAANTPAVMMFVFSSKITFFGLIIAQLALVFVLSGMVQRLSAGMATTLFMLYSALTGLTLSSIFIAYTYSSIASTFVVTGGMFGAMSLYGYTTKRDLSGFGSMLFMGLIGIVLASLVNLWLKSEALMWAVTYIGVVLFVGLTAYDTQKLKNIGEQIDTRDSATLRKYSILGALTLYLDFHQPVPDAAAYYGQPPLTSLYQRVASNARQAQRRRAISGTVPVFAGWRLRLPGLHHCLPHGHVRRAAPASFLAASAYLYAEATAAGYRQARYPCRVAAAPYPAYRLQAQRRRARYQARYPAGWRLRLTRPTGSSHRLTP